MATSDCVGEPTKVKAVVVLLAGLMSLVVGATLEVLVIWVPEVSPALTFTTNGNWKAVPEVMGVSALHVVPAPTQQLMDPVPPTAGRVLQIQPAGIPRETKVVDAGTLPVKTPPKAEDGPALFTVWVKVTLLPDETGLGDAELLAIKSN